MSSPPAADPPDQSRNRTRRPGLSPQAKTGVKFVCKRTDLLAPCQLANSIVPAGQQRPVLRNFKLLIGQDHCSIEATDQEVGVHLELEGVQTITPGQLLVPANRLTAILNETSDETITIEATATTTLVRVGESEFELNAEDPAAFPQIPTPRTKQYHTVPAGQLREMIHRTTFAAAKEHHNAALTGTLWELDGNELRLVATDAKRLALARCGAKAHGGDDARDKCHVFPTKTMQLLERLLTDPEQVVKVALRENDALVRVRTAVIHTRLLAGRYPAYQQILPKTKKAQVPLTVGSFRCAIRQAAILVDRETQGVIFTFNDNTMTLTTRSPEIGRSKVPLGIEYCGEPVKIALDVKFVADALRTLPDDQTLTLELIDETKPAVFRLGEGYSYLVMPMG